MPPTKKRQITHPNSLIPEKNNKIGHVSPELIKYKKSANLEFLNEQSLHLTQLFNQRIHGNLRKVTPTAGAQADHPHKKFLPDIQASTIF